jgi:hypothetical protein
MYDQFLTASNRLLIADAVACYKKEVGAKEGDGSFWVVYGSFALTEQHPGSDMDVLFVHNQTGRPPARIQSAFQQYPVTIYSISRIDLESDGEARRFGGYFSLKLLNPFVTLGAQNGDLEWLLKIAGGFIGPFARDASGGREFSSPTNLLADSVLARLHLCPWYHSYFVRYFHSLSFPDLWRQMQEVVLLALEVSGQVKKTEGGYQYTDHSSSEDLHKETFKVVARFWSLGSCLHSSQPGFPDFYIKKSEQNLEAIGGDNALAALLQFLETEKADGANL